MQQNCVKKRQRTVPAIERNSGLGGILLQLVICTCSKCISTHKASLPILLEVMVCQFGTCCCFTRTLQAHKHDDVWLSLNWLMSLHTWIHKLKITTHFNYCWKTVSPRKKSEDIFHETHITHQTATINNKKKWHFVQLSSVMQSACVRQQCGAKFKMVHVSTAVYAYSPGQWTEQCGLLIYPSGGLNVIITRLFPVGLHKEHYICQKSWKFGRFVGLNHNENSNSSSCIADQGMYAAKISAGLWMEPTDSCKD